MQVAQDGVFFVRRTMLKASAAVGPGDIGHRQVHRERRSARRQDFRLNIAAMFANNRKTNAETKTRAAPGPRGGAKGIKDSG
jgi:hypothetical protein